MQNINNRQLERAETYPDINQGFDFRSFPYEDFAIVSDTVNPLTTISQSQDHFVCWNSSTINPHVDIVDSQTTVSQSQDHFVCWNSSTINPHVDIVDSQTTVSQSQDHFVCWNSSTVNPHTDAAINSQNQEHFICWNSSTINSQNKVTDTHVYPQSQEHSVWWNSSAQDEIFNGLPNIDQTQSIFASQHLFSGEKFSPLESSKERSRIYKYESKLGRRDDDAVVISEENFTQMENKRLRKSELHNQTERNRRNAIKEKIHTLGGLLPNCTKTDQASILSDVVDHVKTLLRQRDMLSMIGQPMWLAGAQNNITQQIPQYMPYMGMGMGMGMGRINMYGYSGGSGTNHPFLSFPTAPTPSLPIFSESSIVSYPQLQVPPPPLSPATFIAAQVKPSAVTFSDINTIVQPQLIPYTIPANQGESTTSQYNRKGTRDHNKSVNVL